MTLDELITHIPGGTGSVDNRIIKDLEAEIDGGLPAAYRRFLLTCKGGPVGRNVWFRSNTDGLSGHFCVQSVLGDVPGYYLTNAREDYWGRIPEELRPIMLDPYGNVICIGVSGTAQEKVFFWYHEEEIGQAGQECSLLNATNVYFVANTFEEFISKLIYEPAA